MSKPTRSRVYCCITRPGRAQVLVFSHVEDAGVQTPGGTIDPGETPEQAVIREAHEETGMNEFSSVRLIAQDEFENDDEMLIRYFFHLVAPASTPDQWVHRVFGDGEDKGQDFSFRWVDCPGYGDLSAHFHAYLDLLDFSRATLP